SVSSRAKRGAPPTTAQVDVFSFSAMKKPMSLKDHCASLGESGLPAQQRTFDPNLQFSIPDGAEGDTLKAALKNYTVQNVCVLYDVSGSTYELGGGAGGSRFGGGGRFSRGCGGGRFAGADAEDLSASLVPDAKVVEPVGAKTKPIFLAEAEGLSLLLKALPHTGMGSSNFYLLPFDSSPHMPIGISFPQPVSDPKEYDKFAANLDNILPYSGGGTSLAPALSLMMGELGKSALGDTLLVIVTDGQTSDAEQAGRLLSELAAGFSAKNRRLDVLTIGAGSIVSESQPGIVLGVSDEGRLMLSKTRFSHFSHVSGGHHSYSGAQCNDAYLKALTLFKSENGGGRYCGAYRDYRDMMQTALELLSGTNDGSYALWVQGGAGSFWVPKAHQWDIIKDYKAHGTEGADYAYNKSGVIVTVSKDPSAGGLLRVSDEYGRTRCYLFEQKSQIKVKQILDASGLPTSNFDVSSANTEIKARIDWINSHPA
ncbi:MAG: vWA domain-containing protein, partial [Alphaproteobacteria bacterium]